MITPSLRHYLPIAGAFALFGIIFALYNHGIIMLNCGVDLTHNAMPRTHIDEKKEIMTLHFFKHNAWHKEKIEIIYSKTKKDVAIKRLANAWLRVLDEENLMKKKVSIPYVLLYSSENELSICFDRSPFHKEMSSYDKLMWIEGLLKTIREARLGIDKMTLTVHHKPLRDYHLDFSHPWPIQGYSGQ